MFYTYFGDVEPNYSNLKRIEGHLRSIRAISRSCQGRTHKLLLYASVTHVSYLIWGHKTLLYHYKKYWMVFEVNTCHFKVISGSNALKLTREENSYLCLTTASMYFLVYYTYITFKSHANINSYTWKLVWGHSRSWNNHIKVIFQGQML